ncbi:MAG TPA: phage tail protein [Longimicrobium sp.]|jgi:phage tail-like protein|nr:phage tail protein [Longimicrobium sp.]
MSDTYYPPPGFYFRVTVLGAGALVAELTGVDASFQEVSGLESHWETEEVAEGGENRFVHRLPRPARYADLVLKRGLVSGNSFFAEWVGLTIGSRLSLPILTQNLMVTLQGDEGWPLVAWVFVNAWPLRWEVTGLDSMRNEVAVESLEFSYNYFERINLGGAASAALKLASVAAQFAL